MNRIQGYAALFIVAVLAIELVVSRVELAHNRATSASNALRADSLAAALDTTRAIALSLKSRNAILGDSLQALERRAVQVAAVDRDALDKATGRTSVVRTGITVTPGTVKTEALGASTVSADSVRMAVFHVDSSAAVGSTRFVADVVTRIPPPPALASLSLSLKLEPIHLEPRIQCGAPDAGGVRPASLAVLAPVGVTTTLEPLTIDVHACNPDFGRPTGIRVPLGTVGLLLGITAAITAAVVAH
jgi:hypothetical protein